MKKNLLLITMFPITALAIFLPSETYGSPYTDAVQALNPDAYYRSDSSSGAGSDDTGNHDFTSVEAGINFNVAGPRPADGFQGMAATNDAWDFSSGLRAQVADYIPAAGEEPRTVVGWFNTDVTRQQHGGPIDLFGWTSNLRPANTFKGWGLKVQFGMDNSTVPYVGALGYDVVVLNIVGREVQATTTPIEPGDWHMVGVVYDGGVLGNAEIYVDGVLQDLVNDTGVTPADPNFNLSDPGLDPLPYGFSIGRDSGGFAMDGQVDEVAVWESALTGADIQNLWGVAQTGTVVTADFDGDGDRDGADFLAWQRGFDPSCTNCTVSDGDSDGDGDVDEVDLANWETQFGTTTTLSGVQGVPEPSSVVLVLLTCLSLAGKRILGRRRCCVAL